MRTLYKALGLCMILLLATGCNPQTVEDKQDICETNCLNDGWEYGSWAGLNYCNCYNKTVQDCVGGKFNRTLTEEELRCIYEKGI